MNQKEDFPTLNQTVFFQPNNFKYFSKRLIGLVMVAISIYLGSTITIAKQSEQIKQISSQQSVKKLPTNRAYLEQMDVRGIVTGGEGKGSLLPGVNPQHRNIGIREVKSPQEPHKIGLTWLIIHGYNSNPDEIDIANLIDSISTNVPPNDRVLVLDWREVAVNGSVFNFGNFRAATWITPVAEYVVRELNQTYQIDSNNAQSNLNLVGHSLGTFVSSEIGRIYQQDNRDGVGTITALEPSSQANLLLGYDLDGRTSQLEKPHPFREVSRFSRSFNGAKSIAGNGKLASTADLAISLDYGSFVDFGTEHTKVLFTFADLFSQKNSIAIAEN